MPVIEENTGFIYYVEVNLDDVVVIRLVGLHTPTPGVVGVMIFASFPFFSFFSF